MAQTLGVHFTHLPTVWLGLSQELKPGETGILEAEDCSFIPSPFPPHPHRHPHLTVSTRPFLFSECLESRKGTPS